MPSSLFDMHCHLDFWEDPARIAHEAEKLGVGAFAATVTPEGWAAARKRLAGCDNVRVGLGMHPWWIADGRMDEDDIGRFMDSVRDARHIGEIGLDFGKACLASRTASLASRSSDRHGEKRGGSLESGHERIVRELQVSAFSRALEACARDGGHVLSIHAVKSAGVVLDLIEQSGCLEGNACVLHWFSGTSQELTRAIRMGCLFSMGMRSIGTRRGRAYLKAVPAQQLLLETDWPPEPHSVEPAAAWVADLRQAACEVAAVKGRDALELVAKSSRELLGLEG